MQLLVLIPNQNINAMAFNKYFSKEDQSTYFSIQL